MCNNLIDFDQTAAEILPRTETEAKYLYGTKVFTESGGVFYSNCWHEPRMKVKAPSRYLYPLTFFDMLHTSC